MRSRLLGLDLGTATLGIAKSDVLGIAHGYENFRFVKKAYRQAIKRVMEVVSETGIKDIVLGLPLNMDGTQGESAQRSLRFKDELLEADPTLNVIMQDERLTTVTAAEYMMEAGMGWKERKEIIDQQSAIVILQTYLDKTEGK